MTFILAEDAAMRAYLDNIYVSDDKNANRKVGVWFGQPDIEIKQQAYPYITIDLVDVTEGVERAMRGIVQIDYEPGVSQVGGTKKLTQYPIPYNLDYQITSFARQPRHDRSILNTLLQSKFGHRYHSLYIPQDGTERSMFLLGTSKRDRTEDNRRLFVNVFTVRVFSELLPYEAQTLAAKVTSVSTTYTSSLETFQVTNT